MANNTNTNISNQIERMKEMMNYGLKTENKQPYRAVEYERLGADGKTYGIIREGSKYHIKVSSKRKPLKEDYDYIGGFQNHKNYEYNSYANALKQFDMKMNSLNEAYNKKGTSVDSWNIDGHNEIIAEASDKMKKEIARQREIMSNAANIFEGKKDGCGNKECKDALEKPNFKMEKPTTGDAKHVGGDFYTESLPTDEAMENLKDGQKANLKKTKPVVGGSLKEEAINEIAPLVAAAGDAVATQAAKTALTNAFTSDNNSGNENKSKENVEEDCVKEDDDLTMEDFDVEDDVDVEETDFDVEDDDDEYDEEEFDIEDDEEDLSDDELEDFNDEDEELDDEEDLSLQEDETAALKAEIESLRNTIDAIAEKLGVSEFEEDEPLYPEDEDEYDDIDSEEDTEYELEYDGDDSEEDGAEEDFEDDEEEYEVYESRNYRKLMEGEKADKVKRGLTKVGKAIKKGWDKLTELPDEENDPDNAAYVAWKKDKEEELDEQELHVWGKHPRYQKEPFTYPNPKMSNTQGQWEAGDENSPSKGKVPYAKKIGDAKPYDKERVKTAANSIAESIVKNLLKNV